MTQDEVLSRFKESGALLEGHFILRSGLHSRQFFQCAKVLQYPRVAGELCDALAQKIDVASIDTVISPAMGGLFVGHELGRALNKKHIFAEKEEGALVLRRGFTVSPGERFLVAEDVVTQGGRVRETMNIITQNGGVVAAVATIVFRGDAELDLGCPFYSLIRLQVETFAADALPSDLAGTAGIKPGSK